MTREKEARVYTHLSNEILNSKVNVLGAEAFNQIAALKQQIHNMKATVGHLKHDLLQVQQAVLVDGRPTESVCEAKTDVERPYKPVDELGGVSVARRPRHKAHSQNPKPAAEQYRKSHGMVLRSQSRARTLPAPEEDTIAAWQPNHGGLDPVMPDPAFQFPNPNFNMNQMMMMMLESTKALHKRQSEEQIKGFQDASIVRDQKLKAAKLRRAILELSLERRRVRQMYQPNDSFEPLPPAFN
ncbi:MAG: hypothetical protein Q9179_007575 [Wetmoreana sp. 5 TL-2023]